jgi:hypothetical protein
MVESLDEPMDMTTDVLRADMTVANLAELKAVLLAGHSENSGV